MSLVKHVRAVTTHQSVCEGELLIKCWLIANLSGFVFENDSREKVNLISFCLEFCNSQAEMLSSVT